MMIKTMGQHHHGNEAGRIKYLWIKNGWSIVPTALPPRLQMNVHQSTRKLPLAKQLLEGSYLLPCWLNPQISKKYLCMGKQGHFIICRGLDFLTWGSKTINWKAISCNMRVPRGNQIQCQQTKINTCFFPCTPAISC